MKVMYRLQEGIHPFLIPGVYQSRRDIDEFGSGKIILHSEVDEKILSKLMSLNIRVFALNKGHSICFLTYELFFVDFKLSKFIISSYTSGLFDEVVKMEVDMDKFKHSIEKFNDNVSTAEKEAVNHPDHYGGKDNPYEVIKIIEALNVSFHIGNVLKYILRAGKKNSKELEDLKKARWYLDRYIELVSENNK
jgi:hypothetical protein